MIKIGRLSQPKMEHKLQITVRNTQYKHTQLALHVYEIRSYRKFIMPDCMVWRKTFVARQRRLGLFKWLLWTKWRNQTVDSLIFNLFSGNWCFLPRDAKRPRELQPAQTETIVNKNDCLPWFRRRRQSARWHKCNNLKTICRDYFLISNVMTFLK